jgi:hypothetical protein
VIRSCTGQHIPLCQSAAALGLQAHGTTSHFADASPCGTRQWIATQQAVHTAICLAVKAMMAIVILIRAMGPTCSRRQVTSQICTGPEASTEALQSRRPLAHHWRARAWLAEVRTRRTRRLATWTPTTTRASATAANLPAVTDVAPSLQGLAPGHDGARSSCSAPRAPQARVSTKQILGVRRHRYEQ